MYVEYYIYMILYVDETENEQYFILTSLLAPNRASVDMAYKHFKNRIKNLSIMIMNMSNSLLKK